MTVVPPNKPYTGVGACRRLSDRFHYDKSGVCGAYDPRIRAAADLTV